MKRLIHKYKIESRECVVEMPLLAKIIKFDIQDGVPVVWAIFNELVRDRFEQRKVFLAYTGHEFDFEGVYVGTATSTKNGLVYHCFVSGQSV